MQKALHKITTIVLLTSSIQIKTNAHYHPWSQYLTNREAYIMICHSHDFSKKKIMLDAMPQRTHDTYMIHPVTILMIKGYEILQLIKDITAALFTAQTTLSVFIYTNISIQNRICNQHSILTKLCLDVLSWRSSTIASGWRVFLVLLNISGQPVPVYRTNCCKFEFIQKQAMWFSHKLLKITIAADPAYVAFDNEPTNPPLDLRLQTFPFKKKEKITNYIISSTNILVPTCNVNRFSTTVISSGWCEWGSDFAVCA